MADNVLLGTTNEDTALIASVTQIETEYQKEFTNFFKESLQNYKRVAGYIYSKADLDKLNEEERPSFIYNLLLPKIMNLAGAFIDNQSKVEAQPRTPGDLGLANILDDIIDYVHYTGNDLSTVMAAAYVCSIIGRVGWIHGEYSYERDKEGMYTLQNYDPFRIMWNTGQTTKDMKRCNAIIDRAWYTPEEIKMMFAQNNPDMWAEIDEKSKNHFGIDPKTRKLVRPMERITGSDINYPGEDQGYDSVTQSMHGNIYNNFNYFDSNRGFFKVLEVHERRVEKILKMLDYTTGKWHDITKFVELQSDGKTYDMDKMELLRYHYPESRITPDTISQIYQSSVCPALNMKLYDAPYEVQNGNFKPTPIFCFDFGMDSMDWKSYVDHMADPVSSFNLNMNTMLTYLMKATNGETWVEEGALGKHEEEFKSNKIGAVKTVEQGGLDRIERKEPPPLPPGLMQFNQSNLMLIQEISGIHDNSEGKKETANESGIAVSQRVAQTDKMQSWAQNNAVNALKLIGQNTLDYTLHYFSPGRLIKITRDETNPYWLEINLDFIKKISYDQEQQNQQEQGQGQAPQLTEEVIPGNIKDCKVDITLSKAPFGENQKIREFQMAVEVSAILSKINPALVSPELIIESAPLRNRDKWIQFVRMAVGEQKMQAEMMLANEMQMRDLKLKQDNMTMQQQEVGLKKDQNDLELSDMVTGAVSMAVGQ